MLAPSRNTPDNVLQEEILRERATVLFRAGRRVSQALDALQRIDGRIAQRCLAYERASAGSGAGAAGGRAACPSLLRRAFLDAVNEDIRAFNGLRKEAMILFHELLIVREAMGMRRHQGVEQYYRIPPGKTSWEEG